MPPIQANAFGPYLRFLNFAQIHPARSTWTGSVLYVTHSSVVRSGPPILMFVDNNTRQSLTARMLDTYMEWSFWRFDFNFELGMSPRPIMYWIEVPPTERALVEMKSWNFTLPGADQKWRWGAYSCSGYSSGVDRSKWGGDDHPMIQDLLKQHTENPFHAIVGGGDQLYNDAVFKESEELGKWLEIKNRRARLAEVFTPKMQHETEWFYFSNYCNRFAEKGFREALACIPNVMIWDDHDIFDGWGSYPDDLLNSHVFQGIYQVACRFYLMFQQHATSEMVMSGQTELFGRMVSGNHVSFNFIKQFGPNVSLIGVDIRAERTKKQVVSRETWEMIFARIRELPQTTQHVVLVLTVPILYPKVPLTEATLEMLSMFNRIDAVNEILQKTGLLSSIMAFDEPELLDDLMDHWTAGPHMQERTYVINRLQGIVELRGFRVMFLSGDVHAAAIGQFYSAPKRELASDPKYMPQIISSAIVNAPPPNMIIKMMHMFNIAKVSVNSCTKEKMVRTFKARYKNTDKVMGRRNYLIVEESRRDQDGLLCTLRLEDPNVLWGPCENFDIHIPPLVGFVKHLAYDRMNSFPPERFGFNRPSNHQFPYVDTLETANALGMIGLPSQRKMQRPAPQYPAPPFPQMAPTAQHPYPAQQPPPAFPLQGAPGSGVHSSFQPGPQYPPPPPPFLPSGPRPPPDSQPSPPNTPPSSFYPDIPKV
ncbi:hypothetical protein BSKO_09457 [Bryopsis sp. KO-2023]|nr:hypothetical protein BSKO_09457 [Bryopsis sp. KO-2023]